MKRVRRNLRAISPVLAVLMMIAVAIAGALVVYAWVMGYIDLSTEKSGQAIMIQSVANSDTDLLVYVQNTGEGIAQLEETGCLYVNGQLVPCTITGVTVSDSTATLGEGETATLRCVGGGSVPGEKVDIKVTTLLGVSAEYYAYPAGIAVAPSVFVCWNKTYGGPDGDGASSLVATSDRGYAIAGNTFSFGVGWDDFWLVKTDEFGNMEWNRTYGGEEIDRPSSVVVTSDGGYAIAGYTKSFGAEEADFWLIKTDAFGNMEWNKTYGDQEYATPCELVVTSDGGYALGGGTDPYADGDLWLAKLDKSGNVEWTKTYEYGGTRSDYTYSLVTTLDGGYALASGSFLITTDKLGNVVLNKTYDEADFGGFSSLVATSDGGYALAGETGSFGAGRTDFLLIKTDAAGNVEWSQAYGGSEMDSACSLVVTSDGGYALAGFTNSFGDWYWDFWLVKADADGNMEWNQAYGGPESDSATKLIVTSDGGYAIAGYTNSFGAGASDFWLVKTDKYGNTQ